MENLPKDCILSILKCLSIQQLSVVALLNKQFFDFANDRMVWKHIATTLFPTLPWQQSDDFKLGVKNMLNIKWNPFTPFTIDDTHYDEPVFDVKADGKEFRMITTDNGVTLANVPMLPSHMYRWSLRIEWSTPGYDRHIGVATKDVKLDDYLGGCTNGWGLWNDSEPGHVYHAGSKRTIDVEKGYGRGDTVSFWFKDGTLGAKINDVDLGVLFNDIPCTTEEPVYPAIYMFCIGDAAIIQTFYIE